MTCTDLNLKPSQSTFIVWKRALWRTNKLFVTVGIKWPEVGQNSYVWIKNYLTFLCCSFYPRKNDQCSQALQSFQALRDKTENTIKAIRVNMSTSSYGLDCVRFTYFFLTEQVYEKGHCLCLFIVSFAY